MTLSAAEAVEEGKALRFVMDAHKTDMIAKGFLESRFLKFDSLLEAVIKKTTTQKAAHSTLAQNTEAQNVSIHNGFNMATKIQNAAKSAFGNNKSKLKEFKIGVAKSKSVSKLAQLLDYLAGACAKYHDELIVNGLTEEDFTLLSNAYVSLVTSDAVQEHSKKLRTVATETRDEAVVALTEEMFKVRSFAKSAFAGSRAILEEFKPIAKGRRKGKKPPVPPSPPTQK